MRQCYVTVQTDDEWLALRLCYRLSSDEFDELCPNFLVDPLRSLEWFSVP